MALLSIPAPLAPETIMVIEAVARVLSQRQTAGHRVLNPDPSILSAAIAETMGFTRGSNIAIGYWIATENATYGRLIELAASVIEQADAIARAAELRMKPMQARARPQQRIPPPLQGGGREGGIARVSRHMTPAASLAARSPG